MRALIVAIAAALALVAGAAFAKPSPSTLTLMNQPSYGEEAVFSIHLGKHYSEPKLAIWCWQYDPFWYAAVAEGVVVKKYSNQWNGTYVTGPLDHHYWNPALPAKCSAVIFVEPRSAKRPEVAITEWVDFRVGAREDDE